MFYGIIPHIPSDPEGISSVFRTKNLSFSEGEEFTQQVSPRPETEMQGCLALKPLFLQHSTPPEGSLTPWVGDLSLPRSR